MFNFYRCFAFFCAVIVTGAFCKKTYPNQPKLFVSDGHLHIEIPEHKSVRFQSSYFKINDHDLLETLKGAENATRLIQTYETFISQYHSKMDDIENRLQNIGMVTPLTNTTNTSSIEDITFLSRLRSIDLRITTLQRNLEVKLTTDDCASNPCKNGGVCLDLFNGFLCQCQSGWEGATCETDIDECTRFKGTDLDCQNGGRCQNLPGTYTCNCQNGWVGIHCTRKAQDCNSGGFEICGHGTCITQNNEVGFKCICDAGWTTDGTHNACSVDVDECKLNHPPCSTNPLVLCTNVPGSFGCQHCPPGYTGNGYYCADIDECQLFNGGCSVAPFVECINTPGSSKCGPCPSGYKGNGKLCSYKGVCNVNNGGCSILAHCVDNPAISEFYVQCICPAGYSGSGIGPNGCVKTSSSPTSCTPNPCVHGTCVTNNSTQGILCICDRRFTGTFCERRDDPCASNPCKNGGTCQKRRGRFICTCPAGFTGRVCNQERQACGEHLNTPNGTLSYPPKNYQFSRGSGPVSCAWTISTNKSMVIQINFTKFSVGTEGPCSTQWFQIHDGRNSLASPLGRFCGKTAPLNGSFITTHNVVYFWIRIGGRTFQKPEFEITWTTKSPDCGSEITGGIGMIYSPGWPNKYPNNRNCYWTFDVDYTKRLLFHVYSLDIGSSSDCTGDSLQFSTNPSLRQRAFIFAKFCNSTVPQSFYSTSNRGYIYFKSNDKDTYSGFQIGYSTVNGVPGCGGTFTTADGLIQSLEMTISMPDPLFCVYEIKVPENLTIKLEFVEMNLDETCDITNVAILQGESDLLGRYCGNILPGPIVAFGNNLRIESTSRLFHPNHWKIKYYTVCSIRYTDPAGSIRREREIYMVRKCTYHIEQPVGNIILLDLELNGSFEMYSQCVPFYIEVRDGDNENSTLIGKYCESGTKHQIQSSANYLVIKVVLPRFLSFSANYTSMDMGCGGFLKKEFGTISYPSQSGDKYSSNKKCRWIIVAPADKVIQLSWMTFNLENSFDCTYDHVEVFDNNTAYGVGDSMGKFCGFSKPPEMLSSSNTVTIDFISDQTIHGDGFIVSYIFIKGNDVCGGNYFTSAGVIRSPGYPNNYPPNRECTWIITVPPGNQIMLNISDFNVEAYSSCRYDGLEIRNGGTSSSPLIGKYCGTNIPKTIPSHANKLFLKFYSDMSRTTRGFKLQWSSAATGCGGTLTSPSGSIMSPHYPEPYTKNTDCLWKIIVSSGSKIQIIFADVDLEKHSACGLDYIQLLDGPSINSESLGYFCSPQTTSVTSTGNSMLVRFRSDISFQGRGFQIQYSSICKNTLTGFGGVIESPNFPNEYPQDQNCLWDITVTEKNKINITFSHFELERSTTFENKSCQFDYVEIEYQEIESYYDMEEPQYQKYGRFCGYNNPGLITLDSNHARIHFVSDSLLLGTGFRLEWRIFGCGGILTDSTGSIKSPNYPKPYPPSIECNWIIAVPLGQSISITFKSVDVEKDTMCIYDFIKLYNGKDTTYPLLTTICKQENPVTFTSTGNNMFVQFQADSSSQGRGFEASYETKPTNCGGMLTAPTGYIISPNYPKNYNRNETCEWMISTKENHRIELIFEDVDLIKTDCNRTYIKVYDGPTQAYPVLETVCGDEIPSNFTVSTFEHLFVEFRSDSYMTSKGFKAFYRRACGATIKTSGSGTIELRKTDFISPLQELMSCTYTIQSEDKSQHVTLTITAMGIEDNYCYDDEYSVKIFNGPFSDSPLIGKYCGTKIPPAIVSDGSALHIEINQEMDFFATYSVLDDQCGGDLESKDGYFASPGWPKTYPNNVECIWTISMGPGNEISLNFLNFTIPESDKCNTDFLEIRETNATGKSLGVFCGTNKPVNISAIGKMYLHFRSSTLYDGVTTLNKGFKAEFSSTINNQLSGPEGMIGNPHYPRPSVAYGTFTWLVTTKQNTRIEISFIDFFIETDVDDECYGTRFQIYDGMDSKAKVLLNGCGHEIPAPVLSSSNMVYIVFDHYSYRLENIFLLKWKEVTLAKASVSQNKTSDCQLFYELEGNTNKTISSPGYPNGYAPNLNCEWIFQTLSQYHIKIRFTERNFGAWPTIRLCRFADVVRVYQKYEKNENWEMMAELCNNSYVYEEFSGTNLMKMEFKTNRNLNGTGFQAEVFTLCGGTLTEPSGFITFNSSTSHVSQCQWNISVRSGRTIKLSFEHFDLEQADTNNCEDYLVIRNGKFADSPFLGNGKFCSYPPEMESTSNHLYLKFIMKFRISPNKAFKLNYREVSIDCGESYQLSPEKKSVEISSPNYPNIPPAHSECIWTFRAPPGESLRIDFEERFDISENPRCTKDYLELRDGGTELSSLIGTFCDEIPSTKFTTDNMLRMKFFTDSEEPRNGFKAKVSLSYCGGTIRGLYGNISSKVPHALQAGSNCTWNLKAPMGYYFLINIPVFQLTHAKTLNCSRTDISKLYLYEHSSIFGNDTQLGTFCGKTNINKPIMSGTNEVMVNYVSKSDKDEFSLNFITLKEGCGGTLVQETGTISSPGYPHIINDDVYCLWTIQVPKGRRISMLMDDVDIDMIHSTLLFIFQGLRGGPVLARTREVQTGRKYETSDNTAHVVFWQSNQSNKRGFKMTFTSDQPTICVGDFNQSSGEIPVPESSKPYICEWEHTTQSKSQTLAIQLVLDTNDTKIGLPCPIFKGGIHIFSSDSVTMAKLCHSSSNGPLTIRSPYPSTTILAVNRGFSSTLNFTLSYKTYKCGGILEEEYGTITSPNFPSSPNTSMECSWLIKLGNDEHQIKINLTNLNLGNDCEKSYLLIYNGDSSQHPKIGRYCKSNKPDIIITQLNQALIEYKYEEYGDKSSKGFSLRYEPVIHGCGGVYQTHTGTIQTPYYDKDYSNNAECLWEIHADDGYTVRLQFFDRFYIEDSDNCTKDYVEIFDWKYEEWVSLGKKCGRNLPEEIVSTQTKLKLLFRSNDKITATGFRAKWNWHCGGELEATKQERYLMSPGYPMNAKANCIYKIVAKNENKVVSIKFLEFNLEKGAAGCLKRNLTIKGNILPEQVFCGDHKPSNQRFRDQVVITYKSTLSFSEVGAFKLIYKDDSCGGNITSPTVIEVPGTFSPFTLQNRLRYFEPRISCSWYVTAPPNQIPVLSINKMSRTKFTNCRSNHLVVYNGLLVEQSKALAEICGSPEEGEAESKPIPSSSNKMLINLEAFPYSFNGFQGEIYFTYGASVGCGGTINLTETKNINAPNNLPYMDCHWTIVAPQDYKVQLEFTKINISSACENPVRNHTHFCTCSFIEVRDGGGPFAETISKLCSLDTNTQRNFTTSWNTAYLRLYTAVAQNDIFRVTLKPVESKCGPSVLTVSQETKELTSPDYPSSYPFDIKCRWVLSNPTPRGRIMLHFEDFDLLEDSDQNSCDDDRLEITDDPERHIISEGFGPNAKYGELSMYSILYNDFMLCGKDSKPSDFYTRGNTVTLSFRSHANGRKGRGFKIKYGSPGCNRTINANEGRIDTGLNGNNCTITIIADKNRTISIYFLAFFLDFSSDCSLFGLEIRENNSTGPQLLQACGNQLPNPVFSDSNQLLIRLYQKRVAISLNKLGLVFMSSENGKGCGGKLFDLGGKFSSPMYPEVYKKDIECTWEIKVPKGLKIALKFTDFDITDSCSRNNVKVITYTDRYSTARLFCRQDNPAIMYSDGILKVTYASSANNGGHGWLAVFKAVKEESDRNFNFLL